MAPLKRYLLALLQLPIAALAATTTVGTFLGVPVSNADAVDVIPNKYIVVYNSSFSQSAIAAKQALVTSRVQKRNLNKRGLTGSLLSTDVQTFNLNGFNAIVFEADDRLIIEVINQDEVAYVEADAKVSTKVAVAQTNAPPGLVRLSHARPNGVNYVFDNSGGNGITAYIVDTGILVTHEEFAGRAVFGANFVNNVVSLRRVGGEKLEKHQFGLVVTNVSLLRIRTKTDTEVTLPAPSGEGPSASRRT